MAFRVISAPDADRNLHIFDSVVCHLSDWNMKLPSLLSLAKLNPFTYHFMSEELHSALYPL